MRNDSDFLRGLLGRPIRIIAVDEKCLPPLPSLILKEVSGLGIVAAESHTEHFFPWHEIVEIHPVDAAQADEDSSSDDEMVDALLGVDSEP